MDLSSGNSQSEARERDSDSAAVGIAHAFGGVVIALVATFVSLLTTGLAIAIAQACTGKDVCGEGFGSVLTIALVAFGIGVSFWIGWRLFRSKKYVGMHSDGPDVDPREKAYAAMLRRRFAYSSMIVYWTTAPISWLWILAAANCSGN